MQLLNLKISNLLSYPYQDDLSKTEGVKFCVTDTSNINVLIGPNGSGKSGFLHIFKQIMKVGLMKDYLYHKPTTSLSQKNRTLISLREHVTQGLVKHFASPDKEARVSMDILLTESDYENMQYMVKHADVLNAIIAKYSSLSVQIPSFAHEEIYAIPSVFSLLCVVDVEAQTIGIQDTYFSQYERFVLLYFQIIELVQICIDLYNEFERKPTDAPLLSLKNTVAFIGSQRDFKHISHVVDPYARDVFLSQERPDDYYAYIGFYLCAKKIWNIISDNFTLKMSKKNIANYPEKLQQSEFYISLSFVIKKYFDLTLHVEYANNLLTFWLIDQHGRYLHFGDLSDGQQSLLSIIFTMYGYDLKEGMLIVNEPEIHFHPQMQRSFSRMLEKMTQNIQTQFILTTYSPLLINESNINTVYRFSKISGSTQVQNPLSKISPDESSLVHLLKFENLSKIFFVNKIIMVEGETDAYFFEFYLRYLHTLPEWKVKLTDYEIININGKGSYKIRSKFLTRFGLQSFFLGDRDNVVDYGFMTQDDLSYYYKQARIHYAGLKKSGKTHRHYNKLVDTLRNVFPKVYRTIVAHIDNLYKKHVFILKKGDIETYLGMPEKGLENTVKFCHHQFGQWLADPQFDTCRKEFEEIFAHIFR